MTGRALVGSVARKELRALLPLWTGCALTLAAVALVGDGALRYVGLSAFVLGCLAIGAQSLGHEYGHRTLGLLLAQPVPRRRLLVIKFVVLALLLVTLAAIAWAAVFLLAPESIAVRPSRALLRNSPWSGPAVLLLGVTGGLVVAPWLTMATRSAMGGVVFTVAIPATLLVAGDAVGLARGLDAADIDRLKTAVLWRGSAIVALVAAAAGWHAFMRLEVVDDHASDIQLWRWRRVGKRITSTAERRRDRRRPAVWRLIAKELRLQQMTFIITGLYLVTWTILFLIDTFRHPITPVAVAPVTILYIGAVGLLAGSLASAEERQLGTIEWQTLLPMASSRQWAVKAGIALAFVIVVGLGLPLALRAVQPAFMADAPPRNMGMTAMTVVLLTCSSLYVSSLSSSGIRALMTSLPFALATSFVIQFVLPLLWWIIFNVYVPTGMGLVRFRSLSGTLTLAVGLGLAALLLRLGFTNHRSAERGARRVWRQAVLLVGGYLVVVGGALGTMMIWLLAR